MQRAIITQTTTMYVPCHDLMLTYTQPRRLADNSAIQSVMADTKQDAPSAGDAMSSNAPASVGAPKAIIKNVDMAEEMQQDAVDIATAALEKFSIEKDIAASIKKEFDRKNGPTWHVVVGKNFGSYVTHGEPVVHSGHSRRC